MNMDLEEAIEEVSDFVEDQEEVMAIPEAQRITDISQLPKDESGRNVIDKIDNPRLGDLLFADFVDLIFNGRQWELYVEGQPSSHIIKSPESTV